MLYSLTLPWKSGIAVTYLSTKRWEKTESTYPASITDDPLCPVIAQKSSKASYNNSNNITCLENTDSNPED